MAVNYWLDLFTYQTWTEFQKAGGRFQASDKGAGTP